MASLASRAGWSARAVAKALPTSRKSAASCAKRLRACAGLGTWPSAGGFSGHLPEHALLGGRPARHLHTSLPWSRAEAATERAEPAGSAAHDDTQDDTHNDALGDKPGLVDALFDARVHYGHKAGMWNPDNAWFIAGIRAGIHMIDLDVTAAHMNKALAVVRDVVSAGGMVLFVNTRTEHEELTRRTAVCCGEHFVTKKWIGGTLTNNTETIGEQLVPDLMILCGLPVLTTAIKEASQLCIPTIGIVDTNCDATGITVPIPGNDDSAAAVKLYMRLFANEIINAKRANHAGKGDEAADTKD